MRTNKDLLKEVYRLRNLIAGEKGTPQIDPDNIENDYRFQRELKESKGYELREQIDALNREYTRTVEDKQRKVRNDAYFATPEGAAHKWRLEEAIAQRQQSWSEHVQQSTLFLESRLQQTLGLHWGVSSYGKEQMTIGVIDVPGSTPQQRKYYFGQDIDIWYEDRTGHGTDVRFHANCGTTGSFSMEGGGAVGERAAFYVGVGRLLSDRNLVRDIRNTMATTVQVADNLANELARLQKELDNPLTERKQISRIPATAREQPNRQNHSPKFPKLKRRIR